MENKKKAQDALRMDSEKQAFLAAMSQFGNVKSACQAAGIARATFYHWKDTGFITQDEVDLAHDEYSDLLLTELHNRAIVGEKTLLLRYNQPVLDANGNQVYIYVKSDRLLEFKIKHDLKWDDTSRVDLTTHDNPDDNIPAQFRLTFDARELTESEWHTIRSIAENIESRKADKA